MLGRDYHIRSCGIFTHLPGVARDTGCVQSMQGLRRVGQLQVLTVEGLASELDEQELIACGEYGAPQRNSDPHIGGVVNSVARLKADLALANPVGLYFDDLSVAGWATPDGTDAKTFWTCVRGDADHPVRAVFEVPPDAGYAVGDIRILGRPILFGAQIADFISIKATAVGCRIGQSTVEPFTGCVAEVENAEQAVRGLGGQSSFAVSRLL